MRDLLDQRIDRWRDIGPDVVRLFGDCGHSDRGAFLIPSPVTRANMRVIAAAAIVGLSGWDHVSVSLKNRCPNWPEMEYVKRLFFEDNETAMQLHVPPSDHISYHPYCLHLWRPVGVEIPRPPSELVGAPSV